jgi:hypothetical protein
MPKLTSKEVFRKINIKNKVKNHLKFKIKEDEKEMQNKPKDGSIMENIGKGFEQLTTASDQVGTIIPSFGDDKSSTVGGYLNVPAMVKAVPGMLTAPINNAVAFKNNKSKWHRTLGGWTKRVIDATNFSGNSLVTGPTLVNVGATLGNSAVLAAQTAAIATPAAIAVSGIVAVKSGVTLLNAGNRKEELKRRLTKFSDANSPSSDEENTIKAFEHLYENIGKDQNRAVLDGSLSAAALTSAGLALSGVGAPAAVGLGATVAATQGVNEIRKFTTQMGRDQKDKNIKRINIKKAKNEGISDVESDYLKKVNILKEIREKTSNKRSILDKIQLLGSVNEDKNTYAKNERNHDTAEAIWGMEPEDQELAIQTLRIDPLKWEAAKKKVTDAESNDNAEPNDLENAVIEINQLLIDALNRRG